MERQGISSEGGGGWEKFDAASLLTKPELNQWGKNHPRGTKFPAFPFSPSRSLPTSPPNSTPALPSILSHLAASSSQLEGREEERGEWPHPPPPSLPPFGSVFVVTRFKWLLVLSVARTHSLPPDCQSINKAKSSRSQYIELCSQSRKNPR